MLDVVVGGIIAIVSFISGASVYAAGRNRQILEDSE